MVDNNLLGNENDPVYLLDKYVITWYQDKLSANSLAIKAVDLLSQGKESGFLNLHYDRIFCNLNFTNIKPIENKLKIGILCFSHYVDFRPREIIDGKKFSGSEEALIYMSLLLAKDGNRVVVYANVTDKIYESLKPCNPRYLPLTYFDENNDTEEEFDIVICWRMYEFERAKRRGKKVYLWVQDLPPDFIDTKALDGALYISERQKDLFENNMNKPVPYVIGYNGFEPNYYTEEIKKSIERKPGSIIYCSNYGKGLKILLEIWPNVLDKFPNSILNVCFGRTHWNCCSEEDYKYIINKLETLPNVYEKGRLSNSEIAKEMMRNSIHGFPLDHPSGMGEISAIQCQNAGCIPVIIRRDALVEVVHPDAYSCTDKKDYLNILLKALENENKVDREKFIKFAMNFTWEKVLEKWLKFIL